MPATSTEALERRVAMLERLVERLTRRNGTPHTLGRTLMDANDSGAVQTIQTRFDALTIGDNVPVLYHHGFFSVPPIGADVHVSFLNGDRSKAVIVASNVQGARFTGGSPSDVGFFAHGLLFRLSSGGFVITGNAAHTGNYALTGNLSATGSIIAGQGGGDQVGLQTHKHASIGAPPTPGT